MTRREKRETHRAGYDAGLAGRPMTDCPYMTIKRQHRASWLEGWRVGNADWLRKNPQPA